MPVVITLIPYVFSAVLVLAFVFSNTFVSYALPIYLGTAIIFGACWWTIVGWKSIAREQLLIFASPLVFLGSALGFFLMADSVLLQRSSALLAVVALFVTLRALYFFHHKSVKYQPFSLQIQIEYLNTLSIFFVATFLYGLGVFLAIPLWIATSIMLLLVLGMQWQMMVVRRLSQREWVYKLVFGFLIIELFVAISFLPFLIFVKGFLFLVGYYVFLQLYQATLTGIWRRRNLYWLFGGGFALWIITLATAKWF